MTDTATEPQTGIIHTLTADGMSTLCGKDTVSWSRSITDAQLAGLVLTCEACNA